MSRTFPSRNPKWAVTLSFDKNKSKSRPKESKKRQISIQNGPAKYRKSLQLINFVDESRMQINSQAERTVEVVQRWHQDTLDKFEMIQNHIIRTLLNKEPSNDKDPENDESENEGFVTASEASFNSAFVSDAETVPTKQILPPSMPLIAEEIEETEQIEQIEQIEQTGQTDAQQTTINKSFCSKPTTTSPAVTPSIVTSSPNKITKRRHTDVLPIKMSDFAMRKKPCLIHSSVLAMSSNKFKKVDDPAPAAVEVPKQVSVAKKPSLTSTSTSTTKTVNKNPTEIKSSVFQTYLETKKLLDQIRSNCQHAPTSNGTTADNTSAYPKPNI